MDAIEQRTRASQIMITIAAFVVVVAGMSAAKVILVPFLLAAFITIISTPPLFWLQRKGLSQWLALVIVVLMVLLVGLAVVSLVGTSVKDFTGNLPGYEIKLKQQTAMLVDWLDRMGVDTTEQSMNRIFDPGAAMKLTAGLLNGLGNTLAKGFLILMIVIFMLLEASSFPAKLLRVLGGPNSSLEPFSDFIGNVKQYMAIKTMVSLVTGLLVFILLAVAGIDYPVLWAILAFSLNFVPNIGSIIAAIPVVLLAIVQFDLLRAALVALGYLVINLVMGSAIEPRFMGRGLGLSTLVVFLSLLFWGWVLGPVGMLLSVPLTITAKIALDCREETRWLAVLLGPAVPAAAEPSGENASDDLG